MMKIEIKRGRKEKKEMINTIGIVAIICNKLKGKVYYFQINKLLEIHFLRFK